MTCSIVRNVRSAIVASIVMALLLKSSEGGDARKCNGTADVLFIIDCSGSIGDLDFRTQANFAAEVTQQFLVGPNDVQFAALTFGSSAYSIFNFNTYHNNTEVQQALQNLTYCDGMTSTGDALNLARTYSFAPGHGSRPNVPRLAIVITDGQSNVGLDVATEARLLHKFGVIVIVIAVGDGVYMPELYIIASAPHLVFLVDEYGVLDAIRNNLAETVCEEQNNATRTNLTTSSNCVNSQNGCVGKRNGNYRACSPECENGYYYSCSNDYSYKMPCPLGWYTSRNGTRFTARLVYDPRTDTCEQEVECCPRDVENYAVAQTNSNGQYTPPGNRPCLDSLSSCVGRPDGNYAKCYPECQGGYYLACSNNETYVMPCATGWYTDSNKRRFEARLVYDPDSDSCQESTNSCPRNPTDGAPSTPVSTQNSTSTHTNTTQCSTGVADILVVLDASGSIGRSNYDIMVAFAADITTYFPVGPNKFQISVLIFSTDVISYFSFNQYRNNKDVYEAILNAPYLDQGTNTAIALMTARVFSFSAINGARPNVDKVVIVVTDGISFYPNATAYQADLLKKFGCTVISVGVGPGAVVSELTDIASKGLVFQVDDFNVLGAIRSALVTTACSSSSNGTSPCITNSCTGKANKNYPACSPECKDGVYYSCSNGEAIKKSCSLGWYAFPNGTRFTAKTVYKPETDSCEQDAEYCPRNPEDHVVIPPPPSQNAPNYNPVCISSEESCYGKRDGNYPICYPGCMRGNYISCSNNETYEMPCASGYYTDSQQQRYLDKMIYDPATDSCELEVPFCPRSTRVALPTQPPTTTTTTTTTTTRRTTTTTRTTPTTTRPTSTTTTRPPTTTTTRTTPTTTRPTTTTTRPTTTTTRPTPTTPRLTTTTPRPTTTTSRPTTTTTRTTTTTTRPPTSTTSRRTPRTTTTRRPPTTTPVRTTRPPTPTCRGKADILVILDSSGSIGFRDYDLQAAFVANLSTHFIKGPDSIQFSSIVFSSIAVLEFSFTQYYDSTDLWQAFLSVPYFGGGTNTADALKLATDYAFTRANGARKNVPKIVIVLTDGISNNPRLTANEADRLKRSGATVIALGIGLFARYSELLAMASDPRLVYNVTSYNVLDSVERALVIASCGDPDDCVNGTCGDRVDGTYKACGNDCRGGNYYVCSSRRATSVKCPSMWYQDNQINYYKAPGVYDPDSNSCQASSESCPRDPINYRE